jgi:hypothetical protein
VLKLVVAIAFAVLVLRIGVFVLRSIGTVQPPPPPPGELRRVNLRYRCALCGTEVKMTAAPDELPEPPRHCLEDMHLDAPAIE